MTQPISEVRRRLHKALGTGASEDEWRVVLKALWQDGAPVPLSLCTDAGVPPMRSYAALSQALYRQHFNAKPPGRHCLYHERMATVSFVAPPEWLGQIDVAANEQGLTRSEFLRAAVAAKLKGGAM